MPWSPGTYPSLGQDRSRVNTLGAIHSPDLWPIPISRHADLRRSGEVENGVTRTLGTLR